MQRFFEFFSEILVITNNDQWSTFGNENLKQKTQRTFVFAVKFQAPDIESFGTLEHYFFA